MLPGITLVVFSAIFVLANPDLVKSFGYRLQQFVEAIEDWIRHFDFIEITFWFGVAWIGSGMLRYDIRFEDKVDQRSQISTEFGSSPFISFSNSKRFGSEHFPKGFTFPDMLTRALRG